MPVTNVKSKWDSGNLIFTDNAGTEILSIESDGTIDIKVASKLTLANTAVTLTAAQMNLLMQGVAAGYKVARGETSVTGTGDIATGLAAVVQAVATLETDPSLEALFVSVGDSATAGNIVLKVWKPTGAADVTPLAATVAKSVRWIAIGT